MNYFSVSGMTENSTHFELGTVSSECISILSYLDIILVLQSACPHSIKYNIKTAVESEHVISVYFSPDA